MPHTLAALIGVADAIECILTAILENVYYAKLESHRARRLGAVTVKRRRLISDLVSLDGSVTLVLPPLMYEIDDCVTVTIVLLGGGGALYAYGRDLNSKTAVGRLSTQLKRFTETDQQEPTLRNFCSFTRLK